MYKCKDNTIITIGRTFGSGGREIGRKVADELGIPFYDKELLEIEAKEGNICHEYLERFDERKPTSFLYSMAFSPYYGINDGYDTLGAIAQNIQMHAIKTVAEQGSCVIIGRRADQILRGRNGTLNVFISAPLEKRIRRVSKRDGISEKESKKNIMRADRIRRAFYNFYGDGNWGEAENYHLCINSGDLDAANAASMIIYYLKLKDRIVSD